MSQQVSHKRLDDIAWEIVWEVLLGHGGMLFLPGV